MTDKKAIVSLSGGLDSTVSLLWALKQHSEVKALFFDYGQRALHKEREVTQALCQKYGVELTEVNLSFLGQISNSALNSSTTKIPTDSVDITSEETSKKTAQAVWVPNRNGLFINVAASYAESLNFDVIVLGFNKEEAQTFPDNSKAFLNRANEALSFSTQSKVCIESPTLELNKVEILKLGLEMNLDLNLVWPCYFSGESICGQCESCKRFINAKKEMNL